MVRLSLDTIFAIILAFAVITASMLLVTGRWVDIQGFRYKLDAQRYAMDLLNLILSNSPLVERYESEPLRLVLNKEKLDTYARGVNSYGSENPGEKRTFWEKNFDPLEFDYNFTVVDLENGNYWTISNLYFDLNSECYPESMRVSAGVDLPVVISYGKEKHPGKASLYLQKTPLSELTFLVSQAMYRAKKSDEKFLRGLRIDKRNVKDIIFIKDQNRVCMDVDLDGILKRVCKYYYKEEGIDLDDSPLDLESVEANCVDIIVYYTPEDGKKVIVST